MRYLKKLTVLAIGLMLATTTQAQILVMEGEEDNFRSNTMTNGEFNNIIFHGLQNDQTNYLPLGDGALLLAALGGAYLLNRKKKNKN